MEVEDGDNLGVFKGVLSNKFEALILGKGVMREWVFMSCFGSALKKAVFPLQSRVGLESKIEREQSRQITLSMTTKADNHHTTL